MKKSIFGIALIAMSFIALPSMASNDNNTTATPGTEKVECKQGKKDCKGGTKCTRAKKDPFEGINLTDAQKTQLQQLQEKRQAERTAAKAQKGDKSKTMTDAEKQAAKQARMDARRNARQAYLNDVKQILTPEQYVQFLENMQLNKAAGNSKDFKGHGAKMDRKGDRNGKLDRQGKHARHGKMAHKGARNAQKGNRTAAPTAVQK